MSHYASAQADGHASTITEQVHAEIASVLDLMPYDVTPDADLRENFGLTPTDRQQLRTALHKSFGVFLPLDHDVQGWRTVQDIVRDVQEWQVRREAR